VATPVLSPWQRTVFSAHSQEVIFPKSRTEYERVLKSTRTDVQVCRNLLRHEYADRQSDLLLRENETLYDSKQKQVPTK
jgi:hypothetical protein